MISRMLLCFDYEDFFLSDAGITKPFHHESVSQFDILVSLLV